MAININATNSKFQNYTTYNNTEIEQVEELYERLLAEKDKRIQLLEQKVR